VSAETNRCKHCGQPIQWDGFFAAWKHSKRNGQVKWAEAKLDQLCRPSKGWAESTKAEPIADGDAA